MLAILSPRSLNTRQSSIRSPLNSKIQLQLPIIDDMDQEQTEEPMVAYWNSGDAIMWATMALARLKVKIPSFTEAFDLAANNGSSSALRLHNALQSVVDEFANENETASGWRYLNHDDATVLLQELVRAGENYYQESEPEFLQLCSFLTAVHGMTWYAD